MKNSLKKIISVSLLITSIVILTSCFEKTYEISIEFNTNEGVIKGAGKYTEGEKATLTAIPNEGYDFYRWNISGSSKNIRSETYELRVNKDMKIKAEFKKQRYTIRVSSSNINKGEVSSNKMSFIYGEEVKIQAKPREGYEFIGWFIDNELINKDRVYKFKAEKNINNLLGVFAKNKISFNVWKDVVNDSLMVFDYTKGFTSPSDISLDKLAEFAYIKIARECGIIGNSDFIVEESQIKETINKYFNIDTLSLKLNELEDDYKTNDGKFKFNTYISSFLVEPRNYEYKGVKKTGRNKYEARVVKHLDNDKQTPIIYEIIFNLRRNNSIWVINSMVRNDMYHKLVEIEGDVELLSDIKNYPYSAQGSNMQILTSTKDSIIMSDSMDQDSSDGQILMSIDRKNMSVKKYINFQEKVYGFKLIDNEILVKLENEISVFNRNLEKVECIKLPNEFLDYIDQKRKDFYNDDKGVNKYVDFESLLDYDINHNFSKICFTDSQGFKLYNIEDNEFELLVEFKAGDYYYHFVIDDPRFVLESDDILYKHVGYESFPVFYLYQLGESNPINKLLSDDYYNIMYDYNRNEVVGVGRELIEIINLKDFSKEVINANMIFPKNFYPGMESKSYSNGIYATSLTTDNSIFKIDSKNRNVKKVAEVNLNVDSSLSGMSVDIIGVLKDGQILCSYQVLGSKNNYFLIKQ